MLKDQFHLDRKQMQGPPEPCITSCIITSTCWHTLASKITFTRKDNDCRNNIGIQGKNHHAQECICMLRGAQQSYPENQFCLVSVQQMQTLLILFSKSFSYFPHGTCLLSDSIIYSCFDGNYHPLYIPMPRNVTLQSSAVHRHVHMAWGGFTLFGVFFQ